MKEKIMAVLRRNPAAIPAAIVAVLMATLAAIALTSPMTPLNASPGGSGSHSRSGSSVAGSQTPASETASDAPQQQQDSGGAGSSKEDPETASAGGATGERQEGEAASSPAPSKQQDKGAEAGGSKPSKPAGQESGGASKPSSGGGGSGASQKPQGGGHVHSYTIPVYRDEPVYGQQWVSKWEDVYKGRQTCWQCSACGAKFYSDVDIDSHIWGTYGDPQHPNGASAIDQSYDIWEKEDHGSYQTVQTGTHQVLDHYKCSCGATQ